MQEIPYGYCHCGCGQKTNIARQTAPARGLVKGEPYRFLAHHRRSTRPFEDCYEVLPNGCWQWTRTTIWSGYGQVPDRRLAHRVSYELYVGPIPEGMHIDHTCHNADSSCVGGTECSHRLCVNPEHLEPVTSAENSQRGRGSKLTADQARAIRQAAKEGVSQGELAARYGVAKPTVSNIVCGVHWKNV